MCGLVLTHEREGDLPVLRDQRDEICVDREACPRVLYIVRRDHVEVFPDELAACVLDRMVRFHREAEELLRKILREKMESPEAPKEKDLTGFTPVQIPAKEPPAKHADNAPWSKFKRQQRDRLVQLRERGVKIKAIAEASNGAFRESDVLTILEGGKIPLQVYKDLAVALDVCESLYTETHET